MKTTLLLQIFSLNVFFLSQVGYACRPADKGVREEDKEQVFRLPAVPKRLQTVEERLNYVVANYWNHFNFKDTTYNDSSDVIEQVVVDYIDLLERTSPDVAFASLEVMLNRASESHGMLKYINELMRKYLVDSDSPLRNDELYEYVARILSRIPSLDEVAKARVQYDLDLILLNKKGTLANDFRFLLPDGKEYSMHKLESDYLLLLFFNPDCLSCKEVIEELRYSSKIAEMIDRKELLLLTVYPENEVDLWRSFAKSLPDTWMNGYNEPQTILEEHLYDLKATPVLYLLDAEKKVLLKETSVHRVEEFLLNR